MTAEGESTGGARGVRASGGLLVPAPCTPCADEPRGRRAAGGRGVGISGHGRPGPGEQPSGALTPVGGRGHRKASSLAKTTRSPSFLQTPLDTPEASREALRPEFL